MPKMNHSEEEAKELWCPMAAATSDKSQRCLASGCMAWRWSTYQDSDDKILLGVCGLVRFTPDRTS